jgi:hypothetical protein
VAESVLDAEVRVATAEAYQNLRVLKDASDVSSESINRMRDSVAQLDDKLRTIETTLTEATADFQRTGNAIDALRMTDASIKADQYRTALANLKDQVKEVEQQILSSSTAQSGFNKSLDEGKQRTDLLTAANNNLANSAQSMLLSYASLNSVLKLLKDLEEQTKRTIDARRDLGEARLSQDELIQSAAERLGLSGQAGINRTRTIVDKVATSVGGIDTKRATSLIASAQAAGFGVVQEGRADLAGGSGDIVREVGLFARRKRLDDETTTTLFRLLENAGVHTPRQAQGALATIETELQQAAIADPQRGIQTAIKSVSNRMAQGLALPQAIASVAAASVGAATPERGAQNVERLSRAAAGETDKQRLFLGQQAFNAGLITPAMLQEQRDKLAPQFADQTAATQHAQDAIEKAQNELAQINREESNRASDMLQRQRKAAATAELLQQQLEHAKPAARPAIEEKLAQHMDAQEKMQRDEAEHALKTTERRQQIQGTISEQQQKLSDIGQKGQGKLEDAALKEAYTALPLAQREQFLMQSTRGMTPQQIAEFVRNIAQGRAANDLIRQLSPQAQAAYQRALSAGQRPDIGAFEERNTAYLGTDVAKREQANAQAERAQSRASPGGQVFANDLETATAADIKILRSRGEGRASNVAQIGITANLYSRFTNAGTDAGLKAVRMIQILRQRFESYISTMSPASRRKNDKRIQELWKQLSEVYENIVGGYEGVLSSGEDRLAAVQKIAAEVGEFIDATSQADITAGEKPGNANPAGGLPAEHPGDKPSLTMPAAPPAAGSFNATGGGGSQQMPASQFPSQQTPAGGGSQQQRRAGTGPISQVNYNINVGTLVSGNADFADLPPKLSDADLA